MNNLLTTKLIKNAHYALQVISKMEALKGIDQEKAFTKRFQKYLIELIKLSDFTPKQLEEDCLCEIDFIYNLTCKHFPFQAVQLNKDKSNSFNLITICRLLVVKLNQMDLVFGAQGKIPTLNRTLRRMLYEIIAISEPEFLIQRMLDPNKTIKYLELHMPYLNNKDYAC